MLAVSYLLSVFFFLMIRRPPRSTLFPYTRSSDLPIMHRAPSSCLGRGPKIAANAGKKEARVSPGGRRSEEHTSELQSRRDLVCRLLLEKKKSTNTSTPRVYTPESD